MLLPPMPPPSQSLSEHASKALLGGWGIAFARERLVESASDAVAAAEELGFPVALKLCGDAIAHKTERDLVRLGVADADAARAAAEDLLAQRRPEDGDVGVLVAEMVTGRRELIAGLVRDPQLGPCVMLGLGGILAEALRDVVFAAAPLDPAQARALPARLQAGHLLLEPFRGEPVVDLDALAGVLQGLGRLAIERPDIESVDLNPLIVRDGIPVAVDALVVLASEGASRDDPPSPPRSDGEALERFQPLFEPRGIVIAGASSHPGKFGFVTYHNLLRFGFEGDLFPVNREGSEVLGRPTHRDVAEIPDGSADLVFVCTPNRANVELLQACAKKGVRAALTTTSPAPAG